MRLRDGSITQSGHPSASHTKPLHCEVADILSWAQCFGVYIRVVVEKYPKHIKQLLAYQATILQLTMGRRSVHWHLFKQSYRSQSPKRKKRNRRQPRQWGTEECALETALRLDPFPLPGVEGRARHRLRERLNMDSSKQHLCWMCSQAGRGPNCLLLVMIITFINSFCARP